MNKSKYVFTQLTAFLDRNHFNYLVRKYAGDKSSTKLYSKMTKTKAVQVNLIYLIFKLVHF